MKQYVVTGRAKGLKPRLQSSTRCAVADLFIADIGNLLPQVISGAVIVSVVLAPTTTDAAARTAKPGYVSRGIFPDVPVPADGDRRLYLRRTAGDSRSADPARRGGYAMSSPSRSGSGGGDFGDERLEHWVSDEPFDPHVAEALTLEQERIYMASQFCGCASANRLAVWSAPSCRNLFVLISEFIAPYACTRDTPITLCATAMVNLFHDGGIRAPSYELKYELNMENLKREYREDSSQMNSIRFFCLGDSYHFWGLIEMRFHLICPPKNGTLFLLGTDRLGRDMFSRIVMGTRISLTVGLIGIVISFMLGMFFGGLAGYYGGWVDNVTQRVIEVIRSFPELPLWMALSAALPVTWSPILIYFGITIILGLLDWTGLARAVRSKLLSVREEDFVSAARLMGAKPGRIIWRHMMPSFEPPSPPLPHRSRL